MPYDYEEPDGKPVFIINGFLEAGKTTFLWFTMGQEYFQVEGNTLLLVCEEGDTEYSDRILKNYNTIKVVIRSEEELSRTSLEALEAAYDFERVIIEWNGMWLQKELELPEGWFLNQQISIIDTSTFDLYLNNMKPYLGPMLKASELVICNRADGIDEKILGDYRMKIRAMAPAAEIVFEGKEGELRGDFSIDLPYDINAEHIDVAPKDFGIFYVDVMDRPERYAGKTVTYTGEILKPRELGPECFVPGRMVMTCCEADMQFLGLICRYKGAANFKDRDWVKVTARIEAEENEQYGGTGPVLYAQEVVRTGKINEVATF